MEAELDALGDELEADTDTSYLDQALNAPGVPSKEPGYESRVNMKTLIFVVSDGIDVCCKLLNGSCCR